MGVLRYAAKFADKRWTGRVEGRWDSAEREVYKRMVGGGRKVELRQAVITVIFIIIARWDNGGIGGHTKYLVTREGKDTCIL